MMILIKTDDNTIIFDARAHVDLTAKAYILPKTVADKISKTKLDKDCTGGGVRLAQIKWFGGSVATVLNSMYGINDANFVTFLGKAGCVDR